MPVSHNPVDSLAFTKEYLAWLASRNGPPCDDACHVISFSQMQALSAEEQAAYDWLSNCNGAVRRCEACLQHFPYAWATTLDPEQVKAYSDSRLGETYPVEEMRVALLGAD